MKIYRKSFENINNDCGGSDALTKTKRGIGLGNFDGVHIGHTALFRKLIYECRARNIPACVYTFANHPGSVIFKDRTTPLLMTEETKIRILEETGIDELYLEHFDEEYAKTPPEEFVKEILADKLRADLVVVGYDYTFGAFGSGTTEDLKAYGRKYGFDVFVIPPVKGYLPDSGESVTVSSTFLRQMIQDGRMRDFRALTGRYYTVPGRVERGRRVGASIGFPTANILHKEGFALPAFGVYATRTHMNGMTYKSITNVGDNPTFGGRNGVTIETHIIGFNEELYGHDIEVEFLDRMRGEIIFPSPDALAEQLRYDTKERMEMSDSVIKIFNSGGIEIYYVPTDKFKSDIFKVMLCDRLDRSKAYKNALIPSILNAGMRKYPEIADISEKLQEMYGAELSVGASSVGETQYSAFIAEYTAPKYAPDYEGLENDIIDFVFDMITDPLTEDYDGAAGFSAKIFERERSNRDSQILSVVNDKHAYAQKRCIEIMCDKEPYSVYNLGNAGDGSSLTPVSLYEYYKNEYLRRSNIKIFYIGREYPVRITEKAAELFTPGGRTTLTRAYVEKHVPEDDIRYESEKMNVTQGKLFLGYRTNTPPDSPDYYASSLCSAVLGQGPNSKLFMNVREKNSLAYYASSYVIRQKGIMLAFCGVDPANGKKALKLMRDQLEAVRRGEISDVEYTAAVKTIRSELMSCGDSPSLLLSYYFGQTFTDKMTDPETYAERIGRVTRDEVSEAARRMTLDTVFFLTDEEGEGV